MTAQIAYRPAVISSLQKLWVALPIRGATDPREVLDVYLAALQDCSATAIELTVEALIAGKIEEANPKYCPSTAELGKFTRIEQRRIEIANTPKPIPYQPVPHNFKDWRIIQRNRADDLRAQGWKLVAENIGIDDAVIAGKRRRHRPGTLWFWALAESWSPPVVQEMQA